MTDTSPFINIFNFRSQGTWLSLQFNRDKHHRRSIRLKGYNYAQCGAYFITMCAQNRDCLFGDIVDDKIRLNDPGLMIQKWWLELTNKYKNLEMDTYVIMPNHLHGIIFIVGADLCVCPDDRRICPDDRRICPDDRRICPDDRRICPDDRRICPDDRRICPDDRRICPDKKTHAMKGAHAGAPLHRMVQWFKTMSTNEYLRNIHESGWQRLNGKLWQRNYYERIIRNETEMNTIRHYIINNPLQWDNDENKPANYMKAAF